MIGLSIFGIEKEAVISILVVVGKYILAINVIPAIIVLSIIGCWRYIDSNFDVNEDSKIYKFFTAISIILLFVPVIIFAQLPLVGIPNSLFKNSDILGYYGALIGGVVTVLGVYWTLNYESKKSKEERRQERENLNEERRKDSLPILLFVFSPKYFTLEQIEQRGYIKETYKRHDIVIDTTQGSEKHDENFIHEYGYFRIKNVGLGAAIISDIKLIRTNPKEVVVDNSSEKEFNRRIITPNQEKRLSMTIRCDDFNKEDTLYLTFMDLYSNEYSYKIPFNRMINNPQHEKTKILSIDTDIMPNLVSTKK